MDSKNKYENLKIMDPPEAESLPRVVQSTMTPLTVSTDKEETIVILTTRRMDYSYVAGYNVYWKRGKQSTKVPSNKDGFHFRTTREARLYAIGFLLRYLEHFTPENQEAIKRAETEISQGTLF